MGRSRVKIPPRRENASTSPGGARPRHVKVDAATLSELEREERAFRDRRAEKRRNSKKMQVSIEAPLYLEILGLCDKYSRDIPQQVALCIELGVRFYDTQATPHGAPIITDLLPELLTANIDEEGPPPIAVHPQQPVDAQPPEAPGEGWLQDAGLPSSGHRGWHTRPMMTEVPNGNEADTGDEEPPQSAENRDDPRESAEDPGDDDGVRVEL
jgi:hypothetical protein